MEYRNLVTFSKIAELKSFSKAAQTLGYAQSTVTMQIKQLESEMGVQLFERIGKKVFLTSKGELLLEYAYDIIRISQEAIDTMNEDQLPHGTIRIGVVESLCVTILPNIITICKDSYPHIELVVKIATTTKLLDMLSSNEVDMALTLDKKPDNSSFITVVERSDTTHFVAGPLSPLINKKNLSILDIMDETLIMPEQECNCRQLLREKLAEFDKKIKPNVLLEIGNTEIIKSFVEKNLAISMLPKITITEEIKNGTIATLDIVDFEIDIWIQLLYHKNKYLSPAMSSVLSIINETIVSYFE